MAINPDATCLHCFSRGRVSPSCCRAVLDARGQSLTEDSCQLRKDRHPNPRCHHRSISVSSRRLDGALPCEAVHANQHAWRLFAASVAPTVSAVADETAAAMQGHIQFLHPPHVHMCFAKLLHPVRQAHDTRGSCMTQRTPWPSRWLCYASLAFERASYLH